jgi:hypothetical protein
VEVKYKHCPDCRAELGDILPRLCIEAKDAVLQEVFQKQSSVCRSEYEMYHDVLSGGLPGRFSEQKPPHSSQGGRSPLDIADIVLEYPWMLFRPC